MKNKEAQEKASEESFSKKTQTNEETQTNTPQKKNWIVAGKKVLKRNETQKQSTKQMAL